MADAATQKAIEAIWRIESARLIGGLVRVVRDVGLAEDLAQEALVAALERWPHAGIPDNPGAWLMATAKHRAIDLLRRRQVLDPLHLRPVDIRRVLRSGHNEPSAGPVPGGAHQQLVQRRLPVAAITPVDRIAR